MGRRGVRNMSNVGMRSSVGLSLISVLPLAAPAPAQGQTEPIIVSGKCDLKTGVSIGDGEKTPFGCDVGIIARTERGTVLIQFTDKAGVDGRILGFAGTIEGKQSFGADPVQIMGVERLYLKGGGDALAVDRGTCFINWSARKVTSVVCGAAATYGETDVKALVNLIAR